MTGQGLRSLAWAASLFVVGAGFPAAAFAQNGALRGKVVNEDQRAVEQCEIILDFVGDVKRQYKTITDKSGEWVRPGIPAGGGTWTITARKGDLLGTIDKVSIKVGETIKVPDIVILSPAARAAGKKVVTNDEAERSKKRADEINKLTEAVNASVASGNFDDALAKLNTLVEQIDKCAPCYAKIGEVQLRKKDEAAAEAAFLKAIEADPNSPDAYGMLATLYNAQRKTEDAARMIAKANELLSATGGGGGDANALLNQGIIFWNAGKMPEARAAFDRAVKADPKMADAQYWLGLSTVNLASSNQAKMSDAKGPLSEYLKLAPTGQYAEVAKALLATIK